MAKKQVDIVDELLQKNAELQSRLSESEEALNAIRNGEVDAIIVSGAGGEKVFSLTSAETPYRILLENMNEGAVTLNSGGNVLYCNHRFAEMMSVPISQIVGSDCIRFISDEEKEKFMDLIEKGRQDKVIGLFSFKIENNSSLIHLQLSFQPIPDEISGEISIIFSDVTSMKKYQEQLEDMVRERTREIEIANEKLQNDIIEIENARNSLSESERKYHTTLDSIGDAVISTDLNGSITYMNPLSEKLTGWTFHDATNRPVKEVFNVIDEDTGDEIENPVTAALEHGIIFVGLSNHTLLIRKDGSKVCIADSAAVIKDNHGITRGVVLVFRDMTQIRLKDQKLRESEEMFRSLAENIPSVLMRFDSELRVIYLSPTAEWFTGIPSAQFIGKTNREVGMPEDLCKLWEDATQAVFNTGKAKNVEFDLLTPEGKNYFFLQLAPEFGPDGTVSYVLGISTDITERKKSEERLNIALENGNIGLWEWDIKTNVVKLDERTEKMFGLRPGSFRKTYNAFEKLVHEEDISHVQKAIKNSLERDLPYVTLFRTKPESGNTNYISSRALIIKDENGKPVSFTGVCFDVTNLKEGTELLVKKLNEELLRSNKDLESFAYVASHDLQEPLRMVTSFTQLLALQYKDKLDERAHEYISFAVDGSQRMYELLNGLLAYSRIQSKGKAFTRVNLNNVLENVTKNLSLQIKESSTSIEIDKLPEVFADENQMIQLFQNLISNSIKFSLESPRIYISSMFENGNYVFSVKDKGIGIESQYFDRIFKIFQRLHPRDQFEGTGIGLAICRRIIDRHGGNIWVESVPEKGSTFFFTISKAGNNLAI